VTGLRVLITGVANHWGTALALRLAADAGIDRVIGVDTRPPDPRVADLIDVVACDLRSPALARALRGTGADTIVHNDVLQHPEPGRSARHLHDVNVVGTLQLLAACEALPRLRALVVRGSAAIYGSEAGAPSFFSEDLAGRFPPRTRFQRDLAELEGLVAGFARRNAQVVCSVLRLQPVVGAGLDTPVNRLLRLPVVPTVLGFDPRIQLLDADDAGAALVRAVQQPVPGAVNVAAPDVVSLSRILWRLRRPAVPVAWPLYAQVAGLERRVAGRPPLPAEVFRYMRFGRAVDTARMTAELGFTPAYSTLDALERALTPPATVGAPPAVGAAA
jgi:UDP-glucose 4-epimerase